MFQIRLEIRKDKVTKFKFRQHLWPELKAKYSFKYRHIWPELKAKYSFKYRHIWPKLKAKYSFKYRQSNWSNPAKYRLCNSQSSSKVQFTARKDQTRDRPCNLKLQQSLNLIKVISRQR
ncbi:hypothetical protein DPMN_160495 [Dreissena polymorpha]|uniref:Uncharacterized protein n=1 Tax=Dreissena polymorpha TaxID=45954 RepID=A0A9D4ENK5_DREPO|nr:hypothetical protein DPMN_160495 [Dreissena polymorpha]